MNNLDSPDGWIQTLFDKAFPLPGFPNLMLFFFYHAAELLFLSSSFTMATCVILVYVLENIIWLSEATVGCWAHCMIGRESREWGKWNPLGRASSPLTYLDHSVSPLFLWPLVLHWNISHLFFLWEYLLMEVRIRCVFQTTTEIYNSFLLKCHNVYLS